MEPVDTKLNENAWSGLDYWMARVLRECDRARDDFAPEPVHDLRVALRRCRSIANGFMVFDPHPAWNLMKGEGRQLFQQLGALRDTQVMMEWVWRLAPVSDETSTILNRFLTDQETQHKESASEALRDFNRKKWASWARLLSKRAQRIPEGSMALQHLALERWSDAHRLHGQAMRNRSHAAYHRLRIGLKKFRYTIENFLPERHAQWGSELRDYQGLLGEMHDLHVLWQTAIAIKAFPGEGIRAEWRLRISNETNQRLERYRQTMLGPASRWKIWQTDLPQPDQLEMVALARWRAWAAFRDPNFAHSEHVAKLSLQIYDGLETLGLMQDIRPANARFMLEAAALAHDVGIHESDKKHHLSSYRMIRKIAVSPGWERDSLRCVALIARFHRGALPHAGQKAFSGVSEGKIRIILLLSGILRLADAFDLLLPRQIRRLTLTRTSEVIHINVPGYSEYDAAAEKLTAARHLLETSCAMPVLIRQF
jgi:CHAD domain-containing protein